MTVNEWYAAAYVAGCLITAGAILAACDDIDPTCWVFLSAIWPGTWLILIGMWIGRKLR